MDKLDRSLLFLLLILLLLASFGVGYWFVSVFIVLIINRIYFKLSILVVVFLCLVSVARWYFFENLEFQNLNSYIESKKSYDFEVRICGEPDIRLEYVNYIVCVDSIDGSDVSGKVLIKQNLYPSYNFGDSFIINGTLEEPFESLEFSYKDYLKIFKVEAILQAKKLEYIDSKESFRRKLYGFKFFLLRKIETSLNEPYASLMNGLLFGARKGFTDSVNDMLTATGLTHIVAVSGYNVSLVILFVERSLFFIPRNIRFWFLIVAIFLFAIIAGLSASVIRACIMGFISVFVLQYGFSGNFLRAVLLTAIVMIMWNPAYLYFDLGFQLSFYATLGVMYVAPFFKFDFITDKFGLRDSLKLTVASQLTTLPTILYYFGNLSFISPLANLVVAPFLPVLMLLGFLILVFGEVPLLSEFLSLITTSISNLFFVLLSFLAGIPYAMIEVPIQNGIILLLTYGLLLIVIFKKK